MLVLSLRPDLTDYETPIALDGVPFVLRWRWSDTESSWYLDIQDEFREPLCLGVKVVIGPKLAKRRLVAGMPRGVLVAVDTSRQGAAPGIEDLGDRVQVYYLGADELG